MRWESAENRFNEQQTVQGQRWRSDTANKEISHRVKQWQGRGENTEAHTTQGSEKNISDKVGREQEKHPETHQRSLECVLIHHLPDTVWILVDVLGLSGTHGERLLDS